jgi:hypothetical protein
MDVPTAGIVVTGLGFLASLAWHVAADREDRKAKRDALREFRNELELLRRQVREHKCKPPRN